jgi:DNA repair exonuclease SbcCD ATPase subunit
MSETIEPETLPETADAIELPETETPEAEAPPDDAPEEEEGEVVVSFGDEAPPPEPEPTPDSNQLKQLREERKILLREKRELEDKLRAKEDPIPEAPLGPEPSLEDYDYDEAKFKDGWRDWTERKRQAEEKAAKANAEARAKEEAWHAKLADYGQAKAKLKVPDYEEAEERIQQLFDVTQQGVMIAGADNPALLVYALGKHPAKAKELAAIKDPVKFAFAVAKLETQMKTTPRPRAAPPPPETPLQSTAPSRSATNATLERLEEEALRTGNRTKVAAYRRQLATQGRK